MKITGNRCVLRRMGMAWVGMVAAFMAAGAARAQTSAVDIAVFKSASLATGWIEQSVLYSVVASNRSGDASLPIVLTDRLPAGLLFESASTSQGAYDPSSGAWTVGVMTAGSTATLGLQARISPGVGFITNKTPAGFDYLGYSLAGFGGRLAAGRLQNVGSFVNAGSVSLYNYDGTIFRTITNPTPADYEQFGNAVTALGTNLLIGAPLDQHGGNPVGAVYLFNEAGTRLFTVTNPTPQVNDSFGERIIALDSHRYVVAARWDDARATDSGVLHLYRTNVLVTTITNPAPRTYAGFGQALATVGTNGLIAGAPYNVVSGRVGVAYLFSTSGALRATLHNPGAGGEFGGVLSGFSTNRIAVGAIGQRHGDTIGQVFLFDTNGIPVLHIPNPRPGQQDQFGLALGDAGSNSLFIGTSTHAYLYANDGTLLAMATNPVFSEYEEFMGSMVLQQDGRIALGTEGVTNSFSHEGGILQFDLAQRMGGTLVNTARLTVAGTDTNPANDQATASVFFISEFADVVVTKLAASNRFDRTSPGTFFLTASNAGGLAAGGVEVTDFLPIGLTVTSGDFSQGAWNDTNRVWLVGMLPSGGQATGHLDVVWDGQARYLDYDTAPERDRFGYSMALLATGLVAVGAPYATGSFNDGGTVHMYDAQGRHVGRLYNPSPAPNDWFGAVMVQVADHVLAVSAQEDDTGASNAGTVYLFNDFMLIGAITNPLPHASDSFGFTMAALGEGRFAISDRYENGNRGVVHVYNTEGTRLFMLTNRTATAGQFGSRMAAVSSNRFAVAAPQHSFARGAVDLYDLNGTFISTLALPNVSTAAEFGSTITRLNGNRFVVGAPFQLVNGQGSKGMIGLYNASSGAYLTTLTNPVVNSSFFFGRRIEALTDGGFVVGHDFDQSILSVNASPGGSIWLYSSNGTLRLAITNPFPDVAESFGIALKSLPDGRLLVGALPDHVFCYDLDGNLRAGWRAPDTNTIAGLLNHPVLVDDQTLALADPYYPTTNLTAGAVWLFNLPLLTGGAATNEARVTRMDDPDTDLSNNVSRAAISPIRADLSARFHRVSPLVQLGQSALYSVWVSNAGPDMAAGVEVASMLESLQIVTGAPSTGVFLPAPSNWTWQVGSLEPGQVAQLDYTARPDDTITNFLLLNHRVIATSFALDPIVQDNHPLLREGLGDGYETDDAAPQAAALAVGHAQQHFLHVSNDVDWVSFYMVSQMVNEVITQDASYVISAEQLGNNSDLQIELWRLLPDGSLQSVAAVNNNGAGSGITESMSLLAPDEGWYFLSVISANSDLWGYESEYNLFIDLTPGDTLVVVAVDRLAGNQPPAGAVATVNGGNAKSFNGRTSVSYSGLAGLVTVRVTTAAGYVAEEDPQQANQVMNKQNTRFGNPRLFNGGQTAGLLFQFIPAGTVTGEIRDAWTGERVADAQLAFRARSGVISNYVYDGFPAFAAYKQPWRTRVGGGFPTNVTLPTVAWDVSVTGPFHTGVFANLLPGLTRGTVSNLGVLYVHPVDTNGNGLSDEWERQHFGAPTNLPPGGDFDGDRFSNRDEYLAGTSPTNPASRLEHRLPLLQPTGLRLSWPTVAGRSYRVRATDTLSIPNWTALGGPWTATTGQIEMEYNDHEALLRTNRAYRVELLVP